MEAGNPDALGFFVGARNGLAAAWSCHAFPPHCVDSAVRLGAAKCAAPARSTLSNNSAGLDRKRNRPTSRGHRDHNETDGPDPECRLSCRSRLDRAPRLRDNTAIAHIHQMLGCREPRTVRETKDLGFRLLIGPPLVPYATASGHTLKETGKETDLKTSPEENKEEDGKGTPRDHEEGRNHSKKRAGRPSCSRAMWPPWQS